MSKHFEEIKGADLPRLEERILAWWEEQDVFRQSIARRASAPKQVLINTPHIADLMLKGEIGEIKEAMDGSGAKGMQTFDTALYTLFKEERIDLEEALNNADSRTNLEAKINFG